MNVYLDHAATAPLRSEVLGAMLPVLKEDFGNPDSLHSFGRRAAHLVTAARDRIAALLGVKPAEVYFTSGGTEADNWAIRCLGAGDLLYFTAEHAAVLSAIPLRAVGKAVPCPCREDGILSLNEFETTMSENHPLVAVMGVNNETGCIQPVAEAARIAHARGGYLFSDCVQAACTQDLQKILQNADAVALSAHKIGGPKGIGALIVKKEVPMKPLIVGGEQEHSLRGGTLNVAGIVGFARALELACEEREAFCAHTGRLRDLFEDKILSALGGGVKTDGANRAPNISHMTFEHGGEVLLNLLDLNGVACSGGAACSAHASLPSHVLLAMGRSEEEARRGVRFSFGRETTEEETLFAAEAVIRAVKAL